MATEKTLKARLKMKHGKASEWALATKFTPLEGEIIVYDVDETYTSPRFKVGDGTTNVNNLKFVNQDELAKITTLGDDLLAVKNGYLPLSGGTVTGTLTINKELYSNAAIISKRNSTPQFIMQNANGAQLGSIYSSSSDGNYGNIVIVVNQDSSSAAYFTFKNDGIFAAPSDIISNGGVLKSSRNTNPCLALTNQNGAWLASLAAVTSDGSYGNAQLAVYKSATEGSTFTFSNQGSFRAPSIVYSSLFAAQSNNNPQLMLQNKNGAPLGMLYMNTTTGGYSSAYLRVYSSASAYSTFNFGNDGKLSCGSLALVTALPISSGGTGSTTASGALTNLGALPLTGGTLTGTLTAKALYASDGNVVGSYLVTQTNNYPEVYFKNATGATLADLFVNTATGSYAPVILRVHADASTSKDFTFGKDGTFSIPNSFSTVMGEFKSNAWPQLFFRNGNGNALAQLVVPTNNGSYSGLAVNVFSNASTSVQYTFNSDGTFVAPAGITTNGNYVSIKNNSYPQLTFSNASGADIGKFFVSTTNGSYAATKIRAYSSASSYYDFQFLGTGSFSCKTINADGIDIGADSLVQLSQNDNKGSGCISIGNINLGDWRVISVADDGRLLIDYTNPIYALGSSVIYSSSQPSSPSTGTIWLKPV